MTPRWMAWMSIAVLATSAPLSGCGLHGRPKVERKNRAAHSAMRAAATEEVEPQSIVSPGIVEPWGAQVELSAQEPGWIAQIVVKEGEVVQAGQLLATLEDVAQRRAVDLAKAEAAEADAAYTKIQSGATREELRQARASYDAAAAKDDLARSASERTKRLYVEGAVPDAEADRVYSEARVESALAERAQARLAELERGPRAEDREAARARLIAARARLQLSEANLLRRRIVAPTAGTVLLSRYHAGEFYNVGGAPLFVLGDLSRLQVRLEVDEIDALRVTPRAACALYSDVGARLGEGKVVRLAPKMGRRALPIESPTARADVRVREVFVEIPATSGLIPGQRVWGHTARSSRGTTGEQANPELPRWLSRGRHPGGSGRMEVER